MEVNPVGEVAGGEQAPPGESVGLSRGSLAERVAGRVGLVLAGIVGLCFVLFAGSLVLFAFVAGDPGPISVGVERLGGQTTLLVPDCGEGNEPPVRLLVTDVDDPYRTGATGPSVAAGELQVERASDFKGWRVTSLTLPTGPVVVRPTETDANSAWFGVLPVDPPDGLSITDLSDDPEGVRVAVVDDVDRLVRVACQYR